MVKHEYGVCARFRSAALLLSLVQLVRFCLAFNAYKIRFKVGRGLGLCVGR